MLKSLIIELYHLAHGKGATEEVVLLIDEILLDNNLDQDQFVPEWLMEWLRSIIDQNELKRTMYEYDHSMGDVSNFIAELEDLINVEWNDYGEAVEVYFPSIEMWACISTEGNFYEVKRKP